MQSTVTIFRYLFAVACCCMMTNCSKAAPAPVSTSVYYQDFMVSSDALGFRLANIVDPERAAPGQHYWQATYDSEGRISVLEVYVPPRCLQSRTVFAYEGKSKQPSRRDRQAVNACTFPPSSSQ